MKELEKFLGVLSDGMRTLAQGVESLAGKVDELAKTYRSPAKPRTRQPPRKPAKKSPKQTPVSTAKPVTATDAILAVIKRHKKGVARGPHQAGSRNLRLCCLRRPGRAASLGSLGSGRTGLSEVVACLEAG